MRLYFKDFDNWNLIKKEINRNERQIFIRAGEIRWVVMGVNVGSEIDGKGPSFTRPALILHVIGSHLAFIVPLSTKLRSVVGYIPFQWHSSPVSLCIHQIRVISQKRILSRKGRIARSKLRYIKQEILKFYSF
jgi:mRNA interferase MazF